MGHLVRTFTPNRMGLYVLFLVAAYCMTGAWTTSYIEHSWLPIVDFPLPPLEACDTECGVGGMCTGDGNSTICVTCGEGRVWLMGTCDKLEECPDECGPGGMCSHFMPVFADGKVRPEEEEKWCDSCGAGFWRSGEHCHKLMPCDEQCGPGQQCIKKEEFGGFYCTDCAEGYVRSKNHGSCTKLEKCDAECGVGGECTKEGDEFECKSRGEGWTRDSHYHCVKLEKECEKCHGGECYKKDGTYHCKNCGDSHTLRWTAEGNTCVKQPNCTKHCGEGSTCDQWSTGIQCYCNEGYAKDMNKCVKLKECDEKCGKGGLCYESSVGEFHVCTQCGEGFILNENECIELTSDLECNEKCGKGALCYNKQCETCGEGKIMTGSSIMGYRCRKTTPCDELCGPGGLCYENGVYCAKCGEGYEKDTHWSRKSGDGGCKLKEQEVKGTTDNEAEQAKEEASVENAENADAPLEHAELKVPDNNDAEEGGRRRRMGKGMKRMRRN